MNSMAILFLKKKSTVSTNLWERYVHRGPAKVDTANNVKLNLNNCYRIRLVFC